MYDFDVASVNATAQVSAPVPAPVAQRLAASAEARLATAERRRQLANLIYEKLSLQALASLPLYVGRYEQWWVDYIDPSPNGPINSISQGPPVSLVDRAILEAQPAFDLTTIAYDSFTFARYVLWSDIPISRIPWMSKQLIKAIAWAIARVGALALNTIRRTAIRRAASFAAGAATRMYAAAVAAASSGPAAPAVAAIGVAVNGVWIALDGYMIWSAVRDLTDLRRTMANQLAECILPDLGV